MAIWFNPAIVVSDLQGIGDLTLGAHLGIELTTIGPDFLQGTMPVDQRTHQPYGLLHGGASCVLAETLGSIGSALVIDQVKFICVGLEINANHVRSVRSGFVTGRATALHLGNSTHIWDIKILDEMDKLVCVSRLTVAVLPKKPV